MAIDFFGVALSGRIRQFPAGSGQKGETIELWVQSEQRSALSDFRALAFVSQVTVEHRFGDNVKLAMVLTPPFEDGLDLLQSELVRHGVGRLEVEFGYSTGTSSGGGATAFSQLTFSGMLQKPDVAMGSDITITLNALGVGYQMNVVGGTEEKSFPKNTTWAEAVEITLKKYVLEGNGGPGLKIDRLYADIPSKDKDRITGDAFFREPAATAEHTKVDAPAPVGVITKGPRNDWWFVRETIEQFGFDLIMHGNEIRIIGKTKYFSTQMGDDKATRKKFLLRGAVDPTKNMFPILNFSAEGDGPWLSPGVGKLLMFDWSEKKNDDLDSYSADATTVASGKGKEDGDVGRIVDVGDEDIQAQANFPGNVDDPDDRARAAANWKDMQMRDGINGEFTTIGIPGLRPGEAVDVSGFEKIGEGAEDSGALFNGTYGIQLIRHQVGVGGWITTFQATMGLFHQDSNLARARVALAASQTAAAEREVENELTSVVGPASDNQDAITKLAKDIESEKLSPKDLRNQRKSFKL